MFSHVWKVLDVTLAILALQNHYNNSYTAEFLFPLYGKIDLWYDLIFINTFLIIDLMAGCPFI